MHEDSVLIHPGQFAMCQCRGQFQLDRFAGGCELAAVDFLGPRNVPGGVAQEDDQEDRSPQMQTTHERVPPSVIDMARG